MDLEKVILFVWLWFSIRFLFFNYWEILFLWPILIILDGQFQNNTQHQETLGDKSPPEIGQTTQKETKFNEQRPHSADLDKLIKKMMEEEKKRILKKTSGKK
ncbi:hypothetical protein NPIL_68571 [Nephila pilipes]|uniref:Uncharacterized protein n=1 Tax=Nephila pilipes TaxID=299642 RepID=A0A8X6IWI4_NEPPI|nr:hypothetical protein NPIL_68571 [Nephila pilipes]